MFSLFLALLSSSVFDKDQKATTRLFSDQLAYSPAPVNNPMKGLVPYAGDENTFFPHSLEFSYLNLSDLVVGNDTYDWKKLETLLNSVAKRGHQTIFRVTVEYPGQPSGVPDFIIKKGLKFTKYPEPGSEDKSKFIETPDYNNPDLQAALLKFIAALGKRYDGDPRIGYITAGLLGCWGEWHTYPHGDLFASPELQDKVMSAYERSFKSTPILLRYPRSGGDKSYTPNASRGFGYHDDSFAWATLDTGRPEDSWFFMAAMKNAGSEAMNKWKTRPIGGEIRPEAWGIVFDKNPSNKQVQDFGQCVRQTHATWLMDSGMCGKKQPSERTNNALSLVQKMGYEYGIVSATGLGSGSKLDRLLLEVKNTGVAPFYANWPVEIGLVGRASPTFVQRLNGSIPKVLPGETSVIDFAVEPPINLGSGSLKLRVVNPLKGGVPFNFANIKREGDVDGWQTIRQVSLK